MSCCGTDAALATFDPDADAILAESRAEANGLRRTMLSVPGVMCGSCVQKVETALRSLPEIGRAHV